MTQRSWYDPREGLHALRWPLDYAVSALLGCIAFVVSYVGYWLPADKMFDEIYFARAAEEYLSGRGIYETTHPPFSKLLITASVWLFGGLHGGDSAHGWRFLNVFFGAVVVVIVFAFAKRLTGSTAYSAFAAGLLICDGMHFVESRIATPEGLVVVFSTGTLYAFYRFWIASQATIRPYRPETLREVGIGAGAALAAGFGLSALLCLPTHQTHAALVVFGAYFALGAYLAFRLAIAPRIWRSDARLAAYPEGARAIVDAAGTHLETPDGGALESSRKSAVVIGLDTRREGDALATRSSGGLSVRYGRDGVVTYETPEGSATYGPGSINAGDGLRENGGAAKWWLLATAALLGLLVASKWYGVMTYGVAFAAVALVWGQRLARPSRALWGNPFGFRLDVAIVTLVFVSASVYWLAWVPDLLRHVEYANWSDIVFRQYFMFHYHDTLKATHPYASLWWQWPFDIRPILYYSDWGKSPNPVIRLIYALPNPLILWAGLYCVPATAYLAWMKRNKGYALIVLAYLFLWLPWARSPRIAFEYHFYVDIPLICLCVAIVLREMRSRALLAAASLVAIASFVFFYPIWSAHPMSHAYYQAHIWLQSWI